MAGAIPILRPLRESLAGDRVTRVLGIVNGTTNFILDKMDTSGAGFAEALEEAQELGYAEADPTADVEGFDAAAKAAILASLAFHSRVTADDVHREGISEVTAADVASAREMGSVVKLLAIAELRHDGDGGEAVAVRVHPAMIPRSHPLASVREAFNAVFVESEAAGQLMFYGPGAGGSPTASAVLGDLVTVARNRLSGTRAPASRRTPTGRCCRWGRPSPATTSRSTSTTAPACWPRWRTAFADHGVSIQTVKQEGRGADAQLVVVSHTATDAQLAATVEQLRGYGHRPRGDLGDAGRGRRGVTARAQWRGVIEEYRDLARDPRRRRGGHAPRGRHPAGRTPAGSPGSPADEVLPQGRGRQPDRLLQGPRHDRRDLGRAPRRRRGRRLRLDRQHVRVDGGVRRARPGSSRSCSCPRARSPPARWRRRSSTAPRSSWSAATSTTASQMARELSWHYPVALVNSVNPVRLEGQKTAAFEIVDFLGDAPDFHVLPVGNAGNISAYWLGYTAVPRPRSRDPTPVMRGFQAEGAAPLVTGEPFPDPETKATAIRIGNPASWKLAEAARDESGGRFAAVSDDQILDAQRQLAAPRRRLRRACVGRRRRRAAPGPRDRASRTPGSRSSSP